MSALEQLRSNPETAIEKSDFFVDVRGYKSSKEEDRVEVGGPTTIKEAKKLENGVTRLNIEEEGTDFFFPWVNRGVGRVTIPANQADGTIVLTGGMNGCAFQVNRYKDDIIFYHDGDSKYLTKPKGDKLCRVEPSLYMKINYGETIVTSKKMEGKGYAYLYQMICVRHGGKWKIVYSGIIIGPGLESPIERSFTPGVSKFLASFKE